MSTSLAATLQGRGTRQPRAWLSPETDRTGVASGGYSVLVVDDNRGVRRLTARMLRAQGYKVLEAAPERRRCTRWRAIPAYAWW